MFKTVSLKIYFIFCILYSIISLVAAVCVKYNYCDVLVLYGIMVIGFICMPLPRSQTVGKFTIIHDDGGVKPSIVFNKTIDELAQYKTIIFDVENIAETSHNNIGDE